MVVLPLSTPISVRVAELTAVARRGVDSAEVQALARALERGTVGATARERARVALELLQHDVPYAMGPPDRDEYREVPETLAHGGECANKSAALVALLGALSIPARALYYGAQAPRWSHVTVQVDAGEGWEFADPSLPGAILGENPFAAAVRLGLVGVL